jgi:cytochrome c biogenesis protein CcdA
LADLILVLLAVFAGLALMVIVLERFASPVSPRRMRQLQRWLVPLVGLMLVLSLVDFYVG